jgi:hypothetical protein
VRGRGSHGLVRCRRIFSHGARAPLWALGQTPGRQPEEQARGTRRVPAPLGGESGWQAPRSTHTENRSPTGGKAGSVSPTVSWCCVLWQWGLAVCQATSVRGPWALRGVGMAGTVSKGRCLPCTPLPERRWPTSLTLHSAHCGADGFEWNSEFYKTKLTKGHRDKGWKIDA